MGPLTAREALLFGPRGAFRGFTLVELMVVLVVAALAAGLVFANLESDPRHNAEREARLLAGALQHAAAAAQWRGEAMGVSAEGHGYRFWRREVDDRWAPYSDDGVLAARVLPAGLTIAPSSYAGTPVPADAILPFRASGRNEPYAITLSYAGGSVTVRGDPLNRVDYVVSVQ